MSDLADELSEVLGALGSGQLERVEALIEGGDLAADIAKAVKAQVETITRLSDLPGRLIVGRLEADQRAEGEAQG